MISSSSTDFYLYDEELFHRHENAKPPIESYYFFPNDLETVEFNVKHPHKTLRRIFEAVISNFDIYEEDKLKELEQGIIVHNTKNPNNMCVLPQNYNPLEKRRYLQATGFDIKKTINLLIENIKWRSELIPPKISDKIIQLLNCGFMYVHGRDNNYRPIIVLQAKVYMDKKDMYTYDDWLNTVIFFMEYIVNNMLIPGQVENWNIITDLEGVSVLGIPSDLKKFMAVLQANYRCRLFVNYILGMGFFVRGVWAIVKTMLDETTVRKVQILSSSDLSKILTFINPEQVEKKFGGTSPNIVPGGHNLFPPVMPSTNFLTKNQIRNKVLISEEDYQNRYQNNLITHPSPYFLKRLEEEKELVRQEQLLKEKLILEKLEYEKSLEIIKTHKEFSNVNYDIYSETTDSSRGKIKVAQKNFNQTRGSFLSWVEEKNNFEHNTPDIFIDSSNFNMKLNH